MAIQIITDSTADLPQELKDRYQIITVPLYVHFGEEVYLDGIDLTPESFLQKIEAGPVFPKTSQPTPEDFRRVFQPILEQGDELLFLGISSELSGTISSALLAAQELDPQKISIIDSRNLSLGLGLLVLHACRLRAQGLSLQEITEAINRLIPLIRISFVVDTLDFLYKGGRLSKTQAVFGNILSIHPRIELVDGKLVVAEKIRGTKAKARTRLIKWATEEPLTIDPEWIGIPHCYDLSEAETITEELRSLKLAKEYIITQVGAIISSHCGPGTFCIAYLKKPE
ncbi:MAG: DegV family protein [Firmicutes bacterium]|nr:DegV family protein [Bacillota bacterium]